MSKPTRYWRYEVTDVSGDVPVEVGAILIDRWKVPAEWNIIDTRTGEWRGGWSAKRLGEVTEPDALAQIAANRKVALDRVST